MKQKTKSARKIRLEVIFVTLLLTINIASALNLTPYLVEGWEKGEFTGIMGTNTTQINVPTAIGYDGTSDYSFEFDGSSSVIYADDLEKWRLDNFTIIAVVKPRSMSSGGIGVLDYLTNKNIFSPPQYYGYALRLRYGVNSNFHDYIMDGDNSYNVLYSDTLLTFDEWHMISMTYDNSTTSHSIFYNGSEEATALTDNPLSYSVTDKLSIGNTYETDYKTADPLDGFIDRIYIFNKTLSEAEIADVYNEGDILYSDELSDIIPPTPPSNTIFHDDFNNADYASEGWFGINWLGQVNAGTHESDGFIWSAQGGNGAVIYQNFSLAGIPYDRDFNISLDFIKGYPNSLPPKDIYFVLHNGEQFFAATDYIMVKLAGEVVGNADIQISCGGSCSCPTTSADGGVYDGRNYLGLISFSQSTDTLTYARTDGDLNNPTSLSVNVTGCDISHYMTSFYFRTGEADVFKSSRVTDFTLQSCIPNWSCTAYAACLPDNTQVCNSVIDLNTCGESYTGDYSEFPVQACINPNPIFHDDFNNDDYTAEGWSCTTGNCIETEGYISSTNLLYAGYLQNFSSSVLWNMDADWQISLDFYRYTDNICFLFTDSNAWGEGNGVYLCPSTSVGSVGKDMSISCQGTCSCSASYYDTETALYRGNYSANITRTGNTIEISRMDFTGEHASITANVDCQLDRLNTILITNSNGDLVYDMTITGEELCIPDWSCTAYAACLPNNTQQCNLVTDIELCSEPYTGDYSEFAAQACIYGNSQYNQSYQAEDLPAIVIDGLGKFGVVLISMVVLIALVVLYAWAKGRYF